MLELKRNSDWWRATVIYHVYLPSFKDSNDDGIGDFKGLTSKLGYLISLHVETIMISPFFPSPMLDNGYDVADFCNVDPMFGTMEDFDVFMATAKEKSLNVILDFPINHTSSDHPWFSSSIKREEPYEDYYVWTNPKDILNLQLPPNNWVSVFGGSAWEWSIERKQFYLHQFLKEQPDLNLRNPLVRKEIKKILEFWLNKGIDGFRVDAASHLFEDELLRDEPLSNKPKTKPDEYDYLHHLHTKGHADNLAIIQEWRDLLTEYEIKDGKYKVLLVEVTESLEDSMRYYGTPNKQLADVPFNFLLTKLTNESTGRDLRQSIRAWLELVPTGSQPNWILSNHDLPRIASTFGRTLSSGLHMVVLLLPGVVFSYYGDELGMENTPIDADRMKDSFALRTKPENSRDPSRTPMQWNSTEHAGFSTKNAEPWLPLNENFKNVNVEVEKGVATSFLEIYRKLMELRKEPSIKEGNVLFPLVDGNIFSLLRTLKGHKSFLVIVNLGLCACVANFKKCSIVLPEEGSLEVTNNTNFDQKLNEVELDTEFPICRYFKSVYKDDDMQKLHVKLNSVFLLPKEAIVVSFNLD